ncbi:MAG: methyltransferase domain-containing protein [Planctomycetes bacterium]|nr:methyltransferase domain-containing protein [Planctomycetota bacterium]
MDQPGLDERLHRQALDGLRRVNWLSRTGSILWRPVERLARELGVSSLRVLDLACGGGDVGVGLARKAKRHGLNLRLVGCDLSPVAVRCACEQAARQGVDAEFRELNVFRDPLPDGFDVVTCSLFLHHLSESDAIEVLRRMAAAARHMILVDDLRRSRFGYVLAWLGCRVLSRSPIVRVDGPLSVRAAFTEREVVELARQAELQHVTLTRHWPQRFLLAWRRR